MWRVGSPTDGCKCDGGRPTHPFCPRVPCPLAKVSDKYLFCPRQQAGDNGTWDTFLILSQTTCRGQRDTGHSVAALGAHTHKVQLFGLVLWLCDDDAERQQRA